jgi:hypothetical protein
MPRRKKIHYEGNPWPKHWDVALEWTVPKDQKLPRGSIRELESRKFEVALKGHPSVWYLFDRYVVNNATGAVWVDAFQLPPHGGFTSFRPEMIVNTRRHLPPRKKTVTVQVANDAV